MAILQEFTPEDIWRFCYREHSKAVAICVKSISIYWSKRSHPIARSRLRSLVRCLRFFKGQAGVNLLAMRGEI